MIKAILLSLFTCLSLTGWSAEPYPLNLPHCDPPINSNPTMSGTLGNSAFLTPSYAYPFMDNNCDIGNDTYRHGPTIDNWFAGTGTPDANPVADLPYIGAQTTVDGLSKVYESFFTKITLQPNQTYTIIFEVSVKNISGSIPALVEIVNQPGNGNGRIAGGNRNCSGNSLLPAIQGPILYSQVIEATTNNQFTNNDAPNFVKVCGKFTTGATVTSDKIWFRFSFSQAPPNNSPYYSNYICIRGFSLYQCNLNLLPYAEIQSACVNGTNVLSVPTNPFYGFTNYQWTKNFTNIAGATQSTYTTNIGGNYGLAISNNTGCVMPSMNVLVDDPLNSADINVAIQSTNCAANEATFVANWTGTGTVLYQWQSTINNGTTWTDIANATQATITRPASAGTKYRVSVKRNESACPVSSGMINWWGVPTISGSIPIYICYGKQTTITALPNGNGPYTYQWSILSGDATLDGSVNNSSVLTTPYTTTTVYQITVTDVFGCSSSTTYALTPKPLPVISFTLPASLDVCQGQYAQVGTTISSGTQPYSYQWTPSSNVYLASGTGSVLSTSISVQNPTYTLTVTDANWCTATKSVTFNIIACRLSENSDASATNVLEVFPVPSHNEITVRYNADAEMKTISVENLQGKEVFQTMALGNEQNILLGQLPAGIYVLKVVDQLSRVKVKKIEISY